MLVNFTKMHGLGNDFVVIDTISQSLKLHSAHIKKISNRSLGIGCDQVLVIEPPIRPEADFYYRIYNSDGNEVEQCGNGARCIARFVIDSGLINKSSMVADCLAGSVQLSVRKDGLINIDFGAIDAEVEQHTIDKPELPAEIFSVSLGNPHGICIVPNIATINVNALGKNLSLLPCFPNEANITFMQLINKHLVKLRTFERGAGATLACGTGACAAVITGQHLGLLNHTVTAQFACGELTIAFDKELSNLQMCGPAVSIFVGRFRM